MVPISPTDVLAKLVSERRPRPDDLCAYEAPEGAVEECIADMWSEVLRIKPIGRKDNLFDLGGDSIHIIQIASRLRQRFTIEIPAEYFFDKPTVYDLALKVQDHSGIQENTNAEEKK